MKKKFTFILSFAILLTTVVFSQNSRYLFSEIKNPQQEFKSTADRWAKNYFSFNMILNQTRDFLSNSPHEQNLNLQNSTFIFSIPKPDGSFEDFKLVESPVMEQGLADAFPDIKTYAGQGIDDPTATMRCDVTQFGFHAMVISANGTYFVNPLDLNTTADYISFYKRDALPQDIAQVCLNAEQEEEQILIQRIQGVANRSISGELRTYRLALACTGEYAAYHGGTVPSALAAMVTSMNRINGVYNREFGIHMNMVANNNLLVYTNAATDPYTNNNGGTMLGQNQTTCNNVIGSANYDIGHVFSTGGGGIAYLQSVCNSANKARGVTGLNTPIGDNFDIDYVAHEMGHQFGGNHTFNANSACAGQGVASAAFEPGSASTIMGYAGICGSQDLQPHSDDYFHTKSFDEIINFTQLGAGNSCAVTTPSLNNAPVLSVPSAPYKNIPLNTPFRLTATATDPDGNPVTYCWEQFDLGPFGNWNAPSGNAPIFRSFDPVTTGTRLFPKLSNILANTTTIGEIKASYARTLHFRCTVRDNILNGAGVTYNDTLVQVIVASTGPFAVLTPNITGIVWQAGTTQTVTWSVGNSNLPPVNTPNVNILLSVDGGNTFTTTLGTNVPNNGSYSFTVPNVSSNTCRVMAEGAGNIFFDINDKNFTINPLGIEENNLANSLNLYPNPTEGVLNISTQFENQENMQIFITDVLGQLIYSTAPVRTSGELLTIDLRNEANGIYFVELRTENGRIVKKVSLNN